MGLLMSPFLLSLNQELPFSGKGEALHGGQQAHHLLPCRHGEAASRQGRGRFLLHLSQQAAVTFLCRDREVTKAHIWLVFTLGNLLVNWGAGGADGPRGKNSPLRMTGQSQPLRLHWPLP